jgi:hypothetical protein
MSWPQSRRSLWLRTTDRGATPGIAVIDDQARLDENMGDPTDVIDATLASRP